MFIKKRDMSSFFMQYNILFLEQNQNKVVVSCLTLAGEEQASCPSLRHLSHIACYDGWHLLF